MAKFINTHYNNTVDKFQTGFKSLLNNPYYLFNNSNPSSVTYYKIHNTKSCLDEGAKIQYSNIGKDSPLRFIKIYDMLIFGLEKIQLNLENNDLGLEAGEISGDCFLLPDTIIPSAGDYFVINHINEKKLFSIDSVNKDTLEDGSNFYKMSYRLEQFDEEEIQEQVVEEQHLIINNIGSNYSSTIRDDKYYLIKELDEQCTMMKTYYKDLFFNQRVQTFTFEYDFHNFYDPYLIEFLLRNKLMEGDIEYLYISHQTHLPNNFSFSYNKSIFSIFERKSLDDICSNNEFTIMAEYISDPTTIFQLRMEDFFEADHIKKMEGYISPEQRPEIVIFDSKIIDYIKEDNPLTKKYVDEFEDNPEEFYNILYANVFVSYFNDKTISKEDLENIKNIDYEDNYILFYYIPLLIYCIEYYIKSLMV